jgi:hypothetical protein
MQGPPVLVLEETHYGIRVGCRGGIYLNVLLVAPVTSQRAVHPICVTTCPFHGAKDQTKSMTDYRVIWLSLGMARVCWRCE